MAQVSTIRSRRRSAGERHALVRLERQIRAADPKSRRKYLSQFAEAFRKYERVISPAEFSEKVSRADVLLVGDYHALPASQRYAARLLRELASAGRAPVLALEAVFARDQHILDSWMRREISADEVRQRVRFDSEWGFDWMPFEELLFTAREHAGACYGIDCMPRHDLRTISIRDRHASAKLAEIRERHANSPVLVLFGESHLAPGHLPRLFREARPGDRSLTILQNVDCLYWLAAGERCAQVEAVQVSPDVVCVFSATPLEKYQSYGHWIDRWQQERAAPIDLSSTFYNLIEALARSLNINPYSDENGVQPRFLIDLLPEIRVRPDTEALRKLMHRHGITGMELANLIAGLEPAKSCYLERLNTIFATGFDLAHAAAQSARFLHLACSGRLSHGQPRETEPGPPNVEPLFYAAVIDEALRDFGARVLHPARPVATDADLYALYASPPQEIERRTLCSYREYMEMVDFVVTQRDYELYGSRYAGSPQLIAEGLRFEGERLTFVTRKLGALLGTELFRAYLEGNASKRFIRSLYFRKLHLAHTARETYFECVRRSRVRRPSLLAA
ncbi:MAG: ChaN family lipoprotein [Acidobacteriales bacterium]|nr:ChaN family lipoprotein [Terriglobales bacterium]